MKSLKPNSREQEYLLLLDTIETHIFYLAQPDAYGMVNRAHAEFFGLKKEDLQYKNINDILSEAEAAVCIAANTQIFSEKKQVVTEELMERADGEKRLFAFTKSPKINSEGVVEYIVCTGEDITEKTRAKAALEANWYFLENVIDSIQDGVSVLDKNFTILHTNKVMRDWYGNSGNLIGKKCFQAFHHSNTQCLSCPTRKALKSGKSESEIIPGLPGTGIDWLEVFSFPLREKRTGKISGVVEFVRDISQRLSLEKQLIQAQKMQAVGTLSGGIAHDFNNILQTLLGSVQLLAANKASDDPEQKYLSLMAKAVSRAQDLTSRLLYLSRRMDNNLEPVNLNNELPDLIKLLEQSLPRMVRIEQHCSEQLWTTRADIIQIEQLIINLAINGGHAMPEGGVLRIETSNVLVDEKDIRSNPDFHIGDYVVLTVSDTGIGMDESTLLQIFEPFFTTRTPDKGTGLGLSMVYGIVKNHGGVITCNSTPGTGTTFRIYFPAISEKEMTPQITVGQSAIAQGNEVVLVVDDEEVILSVTCEILEKFGYRTLQAESGEEALEILNQNSPPVDLVILDMNMPGMGGHKCLLQIREMDTAAKVIVASGYAAEGNSQQMLDSGANAFMPKPYQLQELLATTRRILDT